MVLPYDMSARSFIRTPVARLLAECQDLSFTFVSRDAHDAELLAVAGTGSIDWFPMLRPFRDYRRGGALNPKNWIRIAADLRFALGFYLHLMLVYRFNSIQDFRGFRERLRQSLHLRRMEFREGLATLGWLGFPFPRSQRVFALLYRLLYTGGQRHPTVEKLFDSVSPDLVVLKHLQTGLVTPYVLAAAARATPILGVNGSWDQPTTKGPLVPHLTRILVQSRKIQAELEHHHGVPSEHIEVVGWPQMDIYRDDGAIRPREAFLESIGLPPVHHYILIGAYGQRLGSHEPDLCRTLDQWIREGRFGPDLCLYIRCHPLDTNWQDSFGVLHDPPWVIVEPPQIGALDHLANLLKHAGMVISSASTISLDAVALDTPTIALGFDDESVPYYDRPARRYDMEHYASVIATGGIKLVRDLTQLERAISAYRSNPALDAEGRRKLREGHLAPLNGRAAERLAAAIAAAAAETNA